MDETGVILNILSSVKVLVGRSDLRDYRGVDIEQTIVTATSMLVQTVGHCNVSNL